MTVLVSKIATYTRQTKRPSSQMKSLSYMAKKEQPSVIGDSIAFAFCCPRTWQPQKGNGQTKQTLQNKHYPPPTRSTKRNSTSEKHFHANKHLQEPHQNKQGALVRMLLCSAIILAPHLQEKLHTEGATFSLLHRDFFGRVEPSQNFKTVSNNVLVFGSIVFTGLRHPLYCPSE